MAQQIIDTPKKEKVKKYLIDTTAVVDEVIVETHDTKTLRLKTPNLPPDEPFHYQPGQFVMVRPEINGNIIPRAYSFSSSPTRSMQKEGYFDLTVRQTETPTVSKWLNDRQVGDKIDFRGPYGNFVWDETDPEAQEVFLIGAGSGITPLKCIFEYIHDKKYPNKVELLYSCRTMDEIISKEPLDQLHKETSNSKIIYTLTREPQDSQWKGHRGRIDSSLIKNELEENHFDLKKTKFYMCGTPIFCQTMVDILKGLGVLEDHILHEKWD